MGVEHQHARRADRVADAIAIISSVVLPLAMTQGTLYTGLLQRSMFVVEYLWYVREAARGAR